MTDLVTIEEACDMVTDGTHYTPRDVGTGIPFLTVKDVTDSELDFVNCSFITTEDYEIARAGNSAPLKGDVLFSKDGTVGKVHVVKNSSRFAVLSSLAILRPKRNRVDSEYLGHVLRLPEVLEDAVKRKTGSAIRRIVLSDLKRVQIPLPPIEKQRRIAEILNRAEALRTNLNRSLLLLENLVRSDFSAILREASDRKYPRMRLADAVDLITVGHVGPSARFLDEKGVPYLRTGNVGNGKIILEGLLRITAAFHAQLRKSQLRTGDLLVSRHISHEVRCAIVPQSLNGANCANIIIIRPGRGAIKEYLLNLVAATESQYSLLGRQVGTAQTVVNTKVLQEWEIPLPPLSVQNAFALRLHKVERLKTFVEESLGKLSDLFSLLQHRAFRGEL
jgi:type I restriction enzyme S subunit